MIPVNALRSAIVWFHIKICAVQGWFGNFKHWSSKRKVLVVHHCLTLINIKVSQISIKHWNSGSPGSESVSRLKSLSCWNEIYKYKVWKIHRGMLCSGKEYYDCTISFMIRMIQYLTNSGGYCITHPTSQAPPHSWSARCGQCPALAKSQTLPSWPIHHGQCHAFQNSQTLLS